MLYGTTLHDEERARLEASDDAWAGYADAVHKAAVGRLARDPEPAQGS